MKIGLVGWPWVSLCWVTKFLDQATQKRFLGLFFVHPNTFFGHFLLLKNGKQTKLSLPPSPTLLHPTLCIILTPLLTLPSSLSLLVVSLPPHTLYLSSHSLPQSTPSLYRRRRAVAAAANNTGGSDFSSFLREIFLCFLFYGKYSFRNAFYKIEMNYGNYRFRIAFQFSKLQIAIWKL